MKQLDLNLLRLLVALDSTRHLGRAAESLQMSQSGFSTALNRLRKQLGDDLFVRTGIGMRPTPRAVALAVTARAVLSELNREVVEGGSFVPLHSEMVFRLAMPDSAEALLLPRLTALLVEQAPRTSVNVVSPNVLSLHERLASGDIDIAIGYFPAMEKDVYFRQALFTHTYACIVRRGHPLVAQGMSLAAFQEAGHAVLAIPARSTVLLEAALERHEIRRRVVISTPNLLSLPATIAKTDLIATVPLPAAIGFASSGEIEVLPLPFDPPSVTIYQYWHRRTQREPSCKWLRAQIMSLLNWQTDPYAQHRVALYGSQPTTRLHTEGAETPIEEQDGIQGPSTEAD
jgi:DNA-binding transcriptional LysR family regulator